MTRHDCSTERRETPPTRRGIISIKGRTEYAKSILLRNVFLPTICCPSYDVWKQERIHEVGKAIGSQLRVAVYWRKCHIGRWGFVISTFKLSPCTLLKRGGETWVQGRGTKNRL